MIAPAQRLSVALFSAFILFCLYYYYSNDIFIISSTPPSHKIHNVPSSSSTSDLPESLAYITFFTGTSANKSDPNLDSDVYYTATRILGYQLMHQVETRTQRHIPFVILVPPDVMPEKKERFKKDGATVIEVPYIDLPDWVIPEQPRWKDVMSKLRAWELVRFERAVLFDGDMILNGCMDGVFDDSGTQFIDTDPSNNASDVVPDRYLFASVPEAHPHHTSNGEFSNINYFNAGFFVFGPSYEVFDYYKTKLQEQGTWDPIYPEQNLLNYIHRREGRMPWKLVDTQWNVKFPTMKDKEEGVRSMHDKFWQADIDGNLNPYYMMLRWRMEGFYEGRDYSEGR